jgi:hypothetical protein
MCGVCAECVAIVTLRKGPRKDAAEFTVLFLFLFFLLCKEEQEQENRVAAKRVNKGKSNWLSGKALAVRMRHETGGGWACGG